MVADKDIDEVLRLMPTHANYIFTTPTTQRAMPAQEMVERWCAIHPKQKAITIPQPQEAIQYALTHASEEDAIFIGGSNYLVGEAMKDV
jgi:dihydrofolate synthase/folylpolyglutamate synthase